MITLIKITPDEYEADLLKELQQSDLRKTVAKRCDSINEACGGMGYVNHRYVQELLNEIMDLIRLYGGEA